MKTRIKKILEIARAMTIVLAVLFAGHLTANQVSAVWVCDEVPPGEGEYDTLEECFADPRIAGTYNCVDDSNCKTGSKCVANRCLSLTGEACEANADCVSKICKNNRCEPSPSEAPRPGGGCAPNDAPICIDGTNYECRNEEWTSTGRSCGAGGSCVSFDDCGPGMTCENGSCKIVTNGSCTSNSQCVTGVCSGGQCKIPNGGVCLTNGDCASGLCNRNATTGGYRCEGTAGSGDLCTVNSDCRQGYECRRDPADNSRSCQPVDDGSTAACTETCVSSQLCAAEGRTVSGDCSSRGGGVCCDFPGDDGGSSSGACTAGAKYCAGNTLWVCNPSGTGYNSTSCQNGCDNGACVGSSTPSTCGPTSDSACKDKAFGASGGSCGTCQPQNDSNRCSCVGSGTGGGGNGGGGNSSPSPTPPNTGNTCPNGQGNIEYCVSFSCPHGDTNGDGECLLDDEGADSSGWKTGTDCPRYACGQLDYYTDNDWQYYCGHEWLGDWPNCGSGGTGGGESPNPSGGTNPSPSPGPQCVNITKDVESPQVGDQVRFTCGNVPGANHYKFRVIKGNGDILELNATGRNSEPFNVETADTYTAQCTFCTGQRDRSCKPFETPPGQQ